MPKPRYRSATLGASVDEVEASFYDALQLGDLNQLMACWADEDEIICVHPNGPRLVGAAAIRASFESMLSEGGVRVFPKRQQRIVTLSAAVHSVLERIEVTTADGTRHTWVAATNVYLKTAQGWRLVAHHASLGRAEAMETATTGQLLH